MKKNVVVNVDGVNFNASHYVAKGRNDGVEALQKDHEKNDQTQEFEFDKVYDALEKAVAEAETTK